PVYDKPMICYPLSVLMLMGITDILIISTPRDIPHIEGFLGDGSQFGIKLSYKVQDEPNGIAEAFLLGEEFINNEPVCLMLGDNILHTAQLSQYLKPCTALTEGASVLVHKVHDPERFGIAEFDKNGQVISIEEKPSKPKSNWAVIGVYFYDSRVCEYTKRLERSERGELEITDLNKLYLKKKQLTAKPLGRGTAWMDAGTPESLTEASNFVKMLETTQSFKIACLEEVAFRMKYIDLAQFKKLTDKYPASSNYHKYLKEIGDEYA
ncbi:MAG TPA: glucose-1-phosphate thymidylyltransferase, partial [Rhodospirillaceae bacterium]|nr:glucose-1-phosphate thymidylyltransferase [Rhodospirillaceae bacterium]